MQNPSRDSTTTTKSPSSSPDHPPPPPSDPTGDVDTAEGGSGGGANAGAGSDVRIFPSQVGDVDLPTSVGDGSPAVGEGGSSAVAVAAAAAVVKDGSLVPVEKRGKQKRKPSQLTDMPPGTPTCPVCGKEFPSWKSAFGHMRAHPKREYRGFFKPPAFSSSSPQRQRLPEQGENTGEEQEGASPLGRVGIFDLNQPMDEEEGEGEVVGSSSEAAHKNEEPTKSSSGAERTNEDQKKIGFDLNQLPPAEDDDDKHKH